MASERAEHAERLGEASALEAARSGLMVAKDRDDPEHGRVLAPTKSNLGPPVPALRYFIETSPSGVPRIAWGGAVEYTANELLAENDHPTKSRTAQLDDWLRAQLADGPLSTGEIQRRADLVPWTEKQVRDAKERLCGKPKRVGFGAGAMYVWSLRGHATADACAPSPAEDALFKIRANMIDEGEHDGETSPCSPSASMVAPNVNRAGMTDEGDHENTPAPDLLDTSDAPTLTRRDLTPDLTPQPPLPRGAGEPEPERIRRGAGEPEPEGGRRGCAHEYAMLRDAKGRRARIHCHTIEGADGERLGTSPRR